MERKGGNRKKERIKRTKEDTAERMREARTKEELKREREELEERKGGSRQRKKKIVNEQTENIANGKINQKHINH